MPYRTPPPEVPDTPLRRQRRPASLALITLAIAILCAPLGCAALAAFAGIAAPVATAALDAYTATARAFAGPSASPADVAMLAAALASRDTCAVNATEALTPAADPDAAKAIRALEESAAATRALLSALAAVHADPLADAGASK